MTISTAISSANSSLRAIQTRLAIATTNIANADDPGYTAKTARQSTRVTAGVGTGVDVTGIAGKVDANLVRGIVEATSASAAAAVTADYLTRLDEAMGSLSSEGSGDTLASRLAELESTLDELAATPESTTLASQAVANLDDALAGLRAAADAVAALAAEADAAVAAAVGTANDRLGEIHALNQAIVRARAEGSSTATLEDQRNAALAGLAEQLDVTYFIDGNGVMNVHTGSGRVLVGAQVHGLTLDGGAITVDGQDVAGALRSGTLAALAALRDETLPDIQAELDAIAVSLRDTLNAVANQGSAAPPPNGLTGTRAVAGSDALLATGTLRVAVTDEDGAVVATQDIDLSTLGTMDDLVTALNGVSGLSASLDAAGHLALAATDATHGVAVAGGEIGGLTLSGHFGLNDLVAGEGAADIAVASAPSADATRFPVGRMSTSGTLSAGDVAVSSGSGALARSMADAMRSADLGGQAGTLVADLGSRLATADARAASAETALSTLTGSFQSKYGVNVDEESATIAQLENAYAASAQVLSIVRAMFEDLLNAVS